MAVSQKILGLRSSVPERRSVRCETSFANSEVKASSARRTGVQYGCLSSLRFSPSRALSPHLRHGACPAMLPEAEITLQGKFGKKGGVQRDEDRKCPGARGSEAIA